jgi:hypothetical protein
MFELIAFGGWLFWGLSGIATITLFAAVSHEKVGIVIGTIVSFLAVLLVFGKTEIRGFFFGNWQSLLMWVGIYIGVAVAWAFVKWFILAARRSSRYGEIKKAWFEENSIEGTAVKELSPQLRMRFYHHIVSNVESNDDISQPYFTSLDRGQETTPSELREAEKKVHEYIYPLPGQNKGRISIWMAAWPFSVLQTILGDLLYDLWNFLRKLGTRIFVGLSNLAWRKHRADFE